MGNTPHVHAHNIYNKNIEPIGQNNAKRAINSWSQLNSNLLSEWHQASHIISDTATVSTPLIVVTNSIKLTINPWTTLPTKRRLEVVINRLRIGLTWLTTGFFVRREELDQYRTRGEVLTVKHIILYCRNYADSRTALNRITYMKHYDLIKKIKKQNHSVQNKKIKITKLYNLI
jgi:hypothetical protein